MEKVRRNKDAEIKDLLTILVPQINFMLVVGIMV